MKIAMEGDCNIFVDPAFVDIEAVCKGEIHKYLDGLPDDVKDEMSLRLFSPRIPATREEVLNMIENWTDLYTVSTVEEEEELKTELIGLARSAGVEIDDGLGGKDYQKSLRLAIENMSDDHLLKIGIFWI